MRAVILDQVVAMVPPFRPDRSTRPGRFFRRAAPRLRRPGGDRGDVPGWVMVTLMTAGLVVGVFGVFREAIVEAVQAALAQVVSGTAE